MHYQSSRTQSIETTHRPGGQRYGRVTLLVNHTQSAVLRYPRPLLATERWIKEPVWREQQRLSNSGLSISTVDFRNVPQLANSVAIVVHAVEAGVDGASGDSTMSLE